MPSEVAGYERPRPIRRLRAVLRRSRKRPVACEPVQEFRHSSVSALAPVDRMRFWAVALLWLAVNLAFWGWWPHPTDRSTAWLYWTETVALFYQTTLLPTVFWRFVRKMRRPVESPRILTRPCRTRRDAGRMAARAPATA